MKTNRNLPAAIAAAAVLLSQAAFANPEIIVNDASQEIFPAEWRESPYNAEGEPLSKSEQRECKKIIEEEMEKYPKDVLRDNLKKIHALAKLRYRGVAAVGTNSRSMVYVVKNELNTEQHFRRSFHAEFSSILLRKFPETLDEKAWNAVNPDDFTYGQGGVQAIQEEKASIRFNEELNEEGFLHQYGKASLQEDFNSYAARLFMGDKEMWNAMEKNPKVKAKAELTMTFYRKVSASFSERFFEKLRER